MSVYKSLYILEEKQKWAKPTFFLDKNKAKKMVSANKIEILRIAEAVAQEKND